MFIFLYKSERTFPAGREEAAAPGRRQGRAVRGAARGRSLLGWELPVPPGGGCSAPGPGWCFVCDSQQAFPVPLMRVEIPACLCGSCFQSPN